MLQMQFTILSCEESHKNKLSCVIYQIRDRFKVVCTTGQKFGIMKMFEMFLKEVSHQGCIYFASKNSIIVKYYKNVK